MAKPETIQSKRPDSESFQAGVPAIRKLRAAETDVHEELWINLAHELEQRVIREFMAQRADLLRCL